jgi:DNA-binding XRE family transcriptional regulator
MNELDLKKKRKELGMTQEQLAERLGVNKRTVINYEKGSTIPDSTMKLLHLIFNNEVKEIPNGNAEEISVNGAFELQYLENSNSNSFANLENGQYIMTMPLADYNVQAGLLDIYQDIDQLNELNKHSIIVDKPFKGRYIAFRVKGDSMDSGRTYGVPAGSIATTRELQRHLWNDKLRFKDFPLWVIYTTQSKMPLLKQIIAHDTETGIIRCHSLNESPDYSDFDLSMDDIQALFYVIDINRAVAKYDEY